MRRVGLVIALAIASCSTGLPSDQYVEHEDGLYSAMLDYMIVENRLPPNDVMYVVEPHLDPWQMECGGDDPFNERPPGADSACEAFWSIDGDPKFRLTEGARAEIADAIKPASALFVDDRSDALESSGDRPLGRVKGGAGLLSFGIPLQAGDDVYVPYTVHGEGGFIKATPVGSNWIIDILYAWVS